MLKIALQRLERPIHALLSLSGVSSSLPLKQCLEQVCLEMVRLHIPLWFEDMTDCLSVFLCG